MSCFIGDNFDRVDTDFVFPDYAITGTGLKAVVVKRGNALSSERSTRKSSKVMNNKQLREADLAKKNDKMRSPLRKWWFLPVVMNLITNKVSYDWRSRCLTGCFGFGRFSTSNSR
jgi:hypothetical protein